MNILFVSEFFYPRLAGGEIVSWAILNSLARRGHEIYVVTSRMPDTVEYEELSGIQIFRPFGSYRSVEQKGISSGTALMKRIAFMVKLYFYLSKFLKQHPVDIIYNLGYVTALPAGWAASKFHLPAVSSIRSLCGKTWFQLTNPILALFCYLAEIIVLHFARYNALHCPSSEVAGKVRARTSARVFTIPNPLDLEEIKQVKEDADSGLVRKSIGIKQEEQFLLFVGSLVKVKNVDGLIKSLSKSKTNFKLAIVGEGPKRAKIEKLVKELGLRSRVILLGQKPHRETLSIMKDCDVLILPSKSEVFPNTVLEALALGKPVIATEVGGISEIESENLHLIDELGEINQLLTDGIEAKEDERILEEYSMDKVIARFENLLQSEVQSKR